MKIHLQFCLFTFTIFLDNFLYIQDFHIWQFVPIPRHFIFVPLEAPYEFPLEFCLCLLVLNSSWWVLIYPHSRWYWPCIKVAIISALMQENVYSHIIKEASTKVSCSPFRIAKNQSCQSFEYSSRSAHISQLE